MIKSVNIKNYKGLKNIDIKFNNNVSVFYGKNGIGKTRILSFVSSFKEFLFGKNFLNTNICGKITFDNNSSIEINVLDKELIKFSVIENNKEIIYIDDNGKSNYFSLNDSDVFSTKDREVLKKYNHFKNTPYIDLLFEEFKNQDDKILNQIPSTIEKLLSIDVKTENKLLNKFWEERIKISAKRSKKDNEESLEFKFIQSTLKEEYNKYKKLEKKLSNVLNVIDSNIVKYWVEKDLINMKLNHKIELKNKIILDLFNPQVSKGIRHFFQIIIPLLEVVKSDNKILLIDEFDPYLHDFLYKSLISNLIDEIKDSSQIIFVSHNSNIINMLPLKNIYLVEENKDNVVVRNPNSKGSNTQTTNYEKQYREGKMLTKDIYDTDLMELFDEN